MGHTSEGASLVAQMVKNPPAMHKTRFYCWAGKIPWRSEWLPTLVFLPRKIPWAEKPGRLQSMGLQRAGHDWLTKHSIAYIQRAVSFQEEMKVQRPGEKATWRRSMVGMGRSKPTKPEPQMVPEQGRPSPGPFKGSTVLENLDFGLLTSRTVRKLISLVLSLWFILICYVKSRKLIPPILILFPSTDIHFTGKPIGLPYLLKKKNPLYLESYFSHLKMTFAYFLKVKYYSQVYNGEFTHNHEWVFLSFLKIK